MPDKVCEDDTQRLVSDELHSRVNSTSVPNATRQGQQKKK